MPKAPRLTAPEAEILLFQSGFELLRSEGSHRIYGKDTLRIVIPLHSGKILHPKIVKQVLKVIQPDNY